MSWVLANSPSLRGSCTTRNSRGKTRSCQACLLPVQGARARLALLAPCWAPSHLHVLHKPLPRGLGLCSQVLYLLDDLFDVAAFAASHVCQAVQQGLPHAHCLVCHAAAGVRWLLLLLLPADQGGTSAKLPAHGQEPYIMQTVHPTNTQHPDS